MLHFDDIKFDCRVFNGYKPCVYGNNCPGCPHYQPWDPARAGWKPSLTGGAVASLKADADGAGADWPRILIIKTGALGDVLRTTTLLHPLRRTFERAHITWITAPGALPLLSANPLIDSLVAFDGDAAPALAGRTFDLCVCLEKEGFPLEFARLVDARYKVGYAPTPWGAATIANSEARYMMLLGVNDDLKFHQNTQSYPQIICEATGLEFQRNPYILKLTDAAQAPRQRILDEAARLGERQPIVGLNTGCGAVFRTKQWTLAGWTEMARQLLAEGAAHVVLMGGAAEKELNAAIMAEVPGVIDAGTDNSLEEFFGIVDACDVVVTSDSLGMHVAIALGKYVVALFGSTSHQEIDLYGRGEKVITDFACSPCYLKRCDLSPTCMQAMSPEIVLAAVMREIGKQRSVDSVDVRK